MDIKKIDVANTLIKEIKNLEKTIDTIKRASKNILIVQGYLRMFFRTSYNNQELNLSEGARNKVVLALEEYKNELQEQLKRL